MPKRKRKKEDGSKKEIKYKGVIKIRKTFKAQINIDGKQQHIGMFDTAKQAARAYDRAAMQAGRPPTKLNFQDKVAMDYKPKKKKLSSGNTIGYRGVSKQKNRFTAQIRIGGRQHHIGMFSTAKEAAIAWDLAAIQAKRPRSDLNFEEEDEEEEEEEDEEEEEEDEEEEEEDSEEEEEEAEKEKEEEQEEEDRSKKKVKFKGVCKMRNRFQARVRIDGKQQYIGTFETPKEAAEAYDLAAIQAGHPTSKLNFLDQVPKKYKLKKKKLSSANTIGFRGVYKNGNKFKATIYVDGTLLHLGRFGTTKEAAIAYDFAAIQAKRPKSDLNFPFLHDCRVVEIIPKVKKRRIMR